MIAADWIGRNAVRDVRITEDLIDQFASLSGDDSPIHVSSDAARQCGLRTRVAHGMLLAALVSGVIGTELPGQDGLLHEVHLSFRNPCYPGDLITIEVTVVEAFESVQTLILDVRVARSDGLVLATGRIQSGLR